LPQNVAKPRRHHLQRVVVARHDLDEVVAGAELQRRRVGHDHALAGHLRVVEVDARLVADALRDDRRLPATAALRGVVVVAGLIRPRRDAVVVLRDALRAVEPQREAGHLLDAPPAAVGVVAAVRRVAAVGGVAAVGVVVAAVGVDVAAVGVVVAAVGVVVAAVVAPAVGEDHVTAATAPRDEQRRGKPTKPSHSIHVRPTSTAKWYRTGSRKKRVFSWRHGGRRPHVGLTLAGASVCCSTKKGGDRFRRRQRTHRGVSWSWVHVKTCERPVANDNALALAA